MLDAAAGMAGDSPAGPRPTKTVGAMGHTAGVADGWLHADGTGVKEMELEEPNEDAGALDAVIGALPDSVGR